MFLTLGGDLRIMNKNLDFISFSKFKGNCTLVMFSYVIIILVLTVRSAIIMYVNLCVHFTKEVCILFPFTIHLQVYNKIPIN